MYSDSYEPSWRKFTFRNFCEPLLQSFVIFGCKHLSACCRRGNSLCSMNVGILCENCIKIIFATMENTTSRWMLPRLYEIRCIRNCFFYNMSKQPEKTSKTQIHFRIFFLAKRMSPWSSDVADSHTMQSLSLTLALMPNICNHDVFA